MERSEEYNALCGNATGAEVAPGTGGAPSGAAERAIAAMATALAHLMEPAEAEALNEAAAKLMEGENDGDA